MTVISKPTTWMQSLKGKKVSKTWNILQQQKQNLPFGVESENQRHCPHDQKIQDLKIKDTIHKKIKNPESTFQSYTGENQDKEEAEEVRHDLLWCIF